MKKISLALVLIIILSVFVGCAGQKYSITATEAKSGVVYIECSVSYNTTDENGNVVTVTKSGSGSGFAVGKLGEPVQYIVTNSHVVGDIDLKIISNSALVVFNYAANDYVVAEVIAYDFTKDIAILKLPEATTKRIPLVLCPIEYFNMDDTVATLGFPGLAGAYSHFLTYSIDECVKSEGVVSRQKTDDKMRAVYQTDANILPGNSGGPLINEDGAVIGINTYSVSSIDETGSKEDTVNYAVCIDELIPMLNNKGIKYEIVDSKDGFTTGLDPVIIIGIAGGVIIVALLVVMIVLLAKKGGNTNKPTPVPTERHFINCVGGIRAGASRELSPSSSVTIGRDPSRSDIQYPDNTAGISAVHCVIRMNGNTIEITDNSSYGTFVNGQRIAKGMPVIIRPNDTFYLGTPEHSYRIQ